MGKKVFSLAVLAAGAVVAGWMVFRTSGVRLTERSSETGLAPSSNQTPAGQNIASYRFTWQLPTGYQQEQQQGPRERPTFSAFKNPAGETVTIRVYYDDVGKTNGALVESYREFVSSAGGSLGKTREDIARPGTLQELLLIDFPASSRLLAAGDLSLRHCSVFTITFQTEAQRWRQQVAVFPTETQDYQGVIVLQYHPEHAHEAAALVGSLACEPPLPPVAPAGEGR